MDHQIKHIKKWTISTTIFSAFHDSSDDKIGLSTQ